VDERSSRKAWGIGHYAIVLLISIFAALSLSACGTPLPGTDPTTQTASIAGLATSTPQQTDPAAMPAARPTIALATPWEVEGGAAYQTPTPEIAAVTPVPIVLQGPPAESVFRLSDEVSFLWLWPGELEEDNRFVLYVTGGGQTQALGSVNEINLGAGYQLQVPLIETVGEPGTYGWQVVLESVESGAILGASEIRPFLIVEG